MHFPDISGLADSSSRRAELMILFLFLSVACSSTLFANLFAGHGGVSTFVSVDRSSGATSNVSAARFDVSDHSGVVGASRCLAITSQAYFKVNLTVTQASGVATSFPLPFLSLLQYSDGTALGSRGDTLYACGMDTTLADHIACFTATLQNGMRRFC